MVWKMDYLMQAFLPLKSQFVIVKKAAGNQFQPIACLTIYCTNNEP